MEDQTQRKIDLFHIIVNDMANLYAKKNSNYGDSFGKLYEDLGPIAGLVPLHNKLDRLTNLIKGGENNFESIEDSFKDLACYAVMNLIEIQMKKDEKIQGATDVSKYHVDNNWYTTSIIEPDSNITIQNKDFKVDQNISAKEGK